MNFELKITLWALACAYAIANSFIYSWAFWSAFDINILQFASFTEIFPSILYTVAIPCIAAVIALIAAEFWKKINRKIQSNFDRKLVRKIRYYWHVKYVAKLITLLIIIALLVLAILRVNKEKTNSDAFPWHLMLPAGAPMIVCMLAVSLILTKTNLFDKLQIPRKLAVITFCFIPTVCYCLGYIHSQRIINGKNTFIINSDGQCKSAPNTHYRYISSISDKVFAMSITDKSICIFKYNSLNLIQEKSISNMQPMSSNSI